MIALNAKTLLGVTQDIGVQITWFNENNDGNSRDQSAIRWKTFRFTLKREDVLVGL